MSLAGQVALVTGASRGIGRGIAGQLAGHGATVIITGRVPAESANGQNNSLEQTAQGIIRLGGKAIVKFCDHSNMAEVKRLFEEIEKETGRLDILINNAYSGVPYLAPNMNKAFYESDPDLWEKINIVGLQNHYYCAVYGTRMMINRGQGLIVNLSSFGGVFSLFNAPYGIGKAGLDRMTREMAEELQGTGITVVSLYPGAVRTEMFMEDVLTGMEGNSNIKHMFDEGETPTFVGKAVAGLASDPDCHKMNGRIVLTVDLAKKYGFREADGKIPPNLRSLKHLLALQGSPLAKWIPDWMLCPGWLLWMSTNML